MKNFLGFLHLTNFAKPIYQRIASYNIRSKTIFHHFIAYFNSLLNFSITAVSTNHSVIGDYIWNQTSFGHSF
eukprot:Gb_41678 [translate_table: standard]